MPMSLLFLLLMGVPAKNAGYWRPGYVESHTYKLAESGIPGTSTYTLRSILYDGKPALEVEVETHRVLMLGAQQGKLESHSNTFMDPTNFNLLESRLTTTMNGVAQSRLHAERIGDSIEVRQKLYGSPLSVRTVAAHGAAIDENALNFFLERQDWVAGKTVEWQRYNAAQSRLQPNKATLEKADADKLRIKLESDIGPSYYEIRRGADPVVTRVEAVGAEQMHLEP